MKVFVLAWLTLATAITPLLAHAVDISSDEKTIVIPITNIGAANSAESLNVELSGYDITAFSSRVGDTIEIHLDTPLAPGQYTVYVVASYKDGSIDTLSEEPLQVNASGTQTNWSYNTSLQRSYRVNQYPSDDFESIDKTATNGSGQFMASTETQEWRARVQADVIYDSKPYESSDAEAWELPNYSVELTRKGSLGEASVVVGNHLLTEENLLFSAYQRRGLYLSGSTTHQVINATAFKVHSDSSTAYNKNLAAPSEDNESTYGGTASVSLTPEQSERLRINVGYIDGTGTLAGSGISVLDDTTLYGGKAWNAAVDSKWLNNNLWLHVEHAQSEFDVDGLDQGNESVNDKANHAFLQLSSNNLMPKFGMDQWSIATHYRLIGKDFYSLGNLNLAGNIELRQLSFNGAKGGFSGSLNVSQTQNNVDHDDTLPTMTTDFRGIDLTYLPQVDFPLNGPWKWLGAPAFTAYAHQTHSYQKPGDALLSGYDLDNTVYDYHLQASFSLEQWSWSVGHTYTLTQDHTDLINDGMVDIYIPPSDTTNHLTAFQVSWTPHYRYTTSIFLQSNRMEETDNDNRYDTINVGVDGQYQLIENQLILALNYSFFENKNNYGDSLYDDTTSTAHNGSFQLTWKAIQAQNHVPGVDLFINGSYGKQEDSSFDDISETWQLHAGVSVSWAGIGGAP